MRNDLPFCDNLTAKENALMQSYASNCKWRDSAKFSLLIRHHEEKLDKIREEMLKCDNTVFMCSILRLAGMIQPEKCAEMIKRKTGKRYRLLDMGRESTT
jgi:hypothetical protein